ncbi:hypothetical protein SAMN04488029_0974 [Reichenbachiella faecimaris]|uniref:Uncharacterized protein n=1 Tax=Reichenbachiella faecimaris TaxID=692418 RepID=A0A1W2G7Z1_REIFA|nr:hypothetical protein [Reichenbachiella faecimaris]SMD32624.1 hypothetical protein SAMN04488029_0974 [Reichenbachiella faecimaris]
MKNFSLAFIILVACQPLQKEDLVGLWELETALRDKMVVSDDATYLQIHSNGSYSVSRTTGDMSGVYQLGETKIYFQGADTKGWFNSPWKAQRVKDHLLLAGRDEMNRRIELKFMKVEQIPAFTEFEKQVVGKWEMFLMMKDGIPEKIPTTFMTIDDTGSYIISDTTGIRDQGQSVINTRHHKVIFERDDTHWDVWFWGKELRLLNKEMDIQYHLKRVG